MQVQGGLERKLLPRCDINCNQPYLALGVGVGLGRGEGKFPFLLRIDAGNPCLNGVSIIGIVRTVNERAKDHIFELWRKI